MTAPPSIEKALKRNLHLSVGSWFLSLFPLVSLFQDGIRKDFHFLHILFGHRNLDGDLF